MVDTYSRSDLLFRSRDVLQKLGAFDQPLILGDIEQHGGSTPALGEHERTPGLAHMLNERGGVRTELGERADILADPDAAHE
jgi:hypothetical protein